MPALLRNLYEQRDAGEVCFVRGAKDLEMWGCVARGRGLNTTQTFSGWFPAIPMGISI